MEQSLGENNTVTKDGLDTDLKNFKKFKSVNSNYRYKDLIISDSCEEVFQFLFETVNLSYPTTIIKPYPGTDILDSVNIEDVRTIIDLQPINIHQNLNNYFNSVNKLLPDAGIYFGCVESYWDRKDKFRNKYSNFLFYICYTFDFMLNRVIPKFFLTKKLYNYIFKKSNLVISLAETLGRLTYCGFDILDFQKMGKYNYFLVFKTLEPKLTKNVSSGLMFQMDRIGKAGKIIKVYKLRTMHPYSEYLQRYVLRLNGYDSTGKPANDFRVTSWGKIFRKLWLDELPQLINVLKGDMNIVGVRPLSKVGFALLPDDLKISRINYKPGCIPPNVSLCMKGLEGVMNAERIYLQQMQHKPWLTNFRFFWMAIFNILRNRISSC